MKGDAGTRKLLLIISIMILVFVFVNSSRCNSSSEPDHRSNLCKVTNDLRTITDRLDPNDTILVWLDVFVFPSLDGRIYLHSSDLSKIVDVGARIAGVTFSPDKQSFWFLVETCPTGLSRLIDFPMVKNVSLAKLGAWGWWDKIWWQSTSVDPFLNMVADQLGKDFPNANLDVVLNYATSGPNQQEGNRDDIVGGISKIITSVGGEVRQIGLSNYILSKLHPSALSTMLREPRVETLEAVRPVLLRGDALEERDLENGGQLLLLLAPLYLVSLFPSEPRKGKIVLLAILLLICYCFSYGIYPARGLDVSRIAIRANLVSYTGQGVVVAVIDSGVDYNHTDLASAVLANVDFTGSGLPPQDYNGHGTYVAGIIVSQSYNYRGIAPDAKIVSLKVESVQQVRDALVWCVQNKATYNIGVVQCSCGDQLEQPGDGTDPLSMAADDAVETGMSVVVPVMDIDTNGNGRYEMSNPEQACNVLAIGAINDQGTAYCFGDDTLAYYSAHGPTSDGRPKPDVLAPGDQTDNPHYGIWSTRSYHANPERYEAVNGDYARASGTSAAAPHVSGTIALMLQANPSLTPTQIKAILRQTARLNNDLNQRSVNERGYGAIDAYDAVLLAHNVDNIDRSMMYDSYDVATPSHGIGFETWDYLTFRVDAPSDFGISLKNIFYYWANPFGRSGFELVQRMHSSYVWIDGVSYCLGNDMARYLFSGPRIFEKGDGYVKMRATYLVNHIRITCCWFMHVNAITLWLTYEGGSSWKTLMYVDVDNWDTTNYPYLPLTGETVLIERKITNPELIDIRDVDCSSQYVQIDSGGGSPEIWILRYGYFGDNPDSYMTKNDEYVYNRNIVVHFQDGSSAPSLNIVRKTDQLPVPNSSQNDAGSGKDANNDFDTATQIAAGSYKGTLCDSDPTDTCDWYRFYVEVNQRIEVSMALPYGIDFGIALYDSNGDLQIGSHNGPGCTNIIASTADCEGYWRIDIYSYNGEAQYSFNLSIRTQSGVPWPGGACPILYVYNGTEYVCEGLLGIHNSEGIDVMAEHTVFSVPRKVNGVYLFRLIEHSQTDSFIDQVKLYAMLADNTTIRLPLIWAWHSEKGFVLPQLLFSDDWRIETLGAYWNNGTSQSIDLKFLAPPPSIQPVSFIFQIEGYNPVWKQ